MSRARHHACVQRFATKVREIVKRPQRMGPSRMIMCTCLCVCASVTIENSIPNRIIQNSARPPGRVSKSQLDSVILIYKRTVPWHEAEIQLLAVSFGRQTAMSHLPLGNVKIQFTPSSRPNACRDSIMELAPVGVET